MRENIISASAEVTLDGKAYVLRYRAYAFIFYAEKTGGDLLADLRDVATGLSSLQSAATGGGALSIGPVFAKIRDILWAGLADAQPDLQRDQVARLFGFSDLNELAPLMMAALNLSLPQTVPDRPTAAAPNSHASESIAGPDSGPSIAMPPGSAPPSFSN
jgi:hypothetical protein